MLTLDTASFSGKIVFAGVGNVLKGDDGFGPLLAGELTGRVSFRVFDAGMAPENYLGLIAGERPDTIIFADTGDFGGEPGELRLFGREDLSDSSFFLTHNSSLSLLFEFIAEEGVRADVFIICVQPVSLALGEGLSAEVNDGMKKMAGWFIGNYPAL